MNVQDELVATLRAHESELRAAGIVGLSLFGSVARREERPESDVDVAVKLDPHARIGLFQIVAFESRLTGLLGRMVHLVPEPQEESRFRVNVDRDRLLVF